MASAGFVSRYPAWLPAIATDPIPMAQIAMGGFALFAVTVRFNIPSKWDEMIKKK
ncbi:hypothetical protein MCETE7_02249 [Acidimicrobiia bacterium]